MADAQGYGLQEYGSRGEIMPEEEKTENTAEGTQEDSIQALEEEYKEVFNGLKTKYQGFVTSYLQSFDGRKAAEAVGYSKKSAAKQGLRLCRNKSISLLIRLQQRINSLRGKITKAWILDELKTQYEACVGDHKYQTATRILELLGQHLGMFGKGKEGGDLHLHDHKKYVNYPPVPESIQAWVDQMKEVGYDAALPVKEEGKDEQEGRKGTNADETRITKDVPSVAKGQGRSDEANTSVLEHVTPVTSENTPTTEGEYDALSYGKDTPQGEE